MKQVIKKILSILNSNERQKLSGLAIADVIISLLDILFLAGLLYVINFYTTAKQVKWLHVSLFDDYPLLLITVFFILFAIKNLLGFMTAKAQYNFVYAVASRISRDNLVHYLEGDYTSYVHTDSSVHMRRISQQPIEFCHYVLSGVQQVFSQFVLIIITVVAILLFNPLLFPLLTLVLLPPVFLVAYLMKKKLVSMREHGKKTSELAIQHLQEALAGYIESNVYERNDFFSNRYHTTQERLNYFLAQKLVIQNMPSRLIEVFAVSGLFFLVLFNVLTGGGYAVSIITIGAFMAAAYKVIPGIVKIMNSISQVKTYTFTVTDLLNERKTFRQRNPTGKSIETIEFKNICFGYAGKKVLDDFSLKLDKGDMAGIMGDSGKGKTTIDNLLLGFLSPDSGNILINNTTCDQAGLQAYWQKISYCKQQPFFIHDSIAKNISLSEGAPDQEKLNRIAVATGIDELITASAKGFETIITENGRNFSGGQRQRLIFARALYKNYDCIILDEPFNELDEASEIKMLQHLQQISSEGKIVILVTHNKNALSFCNRKIMLDGYPE